MMLKQQLSPKMYFSDVWLKIYQHRRLTRAQSHHSSDEEKKRRKLLARKVGNSLPLIAKLRDLIVHPAWYFLLFLWLKHMVDVKQDNVILE